MVVSGPKAAFWQQPWLMVCEQCELTAVYVLVEFTDTEHWGKSFLLHLGVVLERVRDAKATGRSDPSENQ